MIINCKHGKFALLFGMLLGVLPANGYARASDNSQPAISLNQTHPVDAQAPASPSPALSARASITGTIVNGNGAGIADATVRLTLQSNAEPRATESDRTGHFSFDGVVPGAVKVTITFPGMETFVSSNFVIHADERFVLPQVSLRVHADFNVQVMASPAEIAQEQLRTLEKQRVFAIFPNFYTSYFSNPASLSTKQKYDLALHAVADSGTFLSAGAVAGVEQAQNIFPGYGQGAQGYAKRFGAATADSAISRMLGSAVLPGILHQDPRYFYKGSGSVRSRIIYALKTTIVCKGDDGRYQPNYSHIGGSFASGAISNLYHAHEDRGLGLTMVQSLLDFTGRASNNLIQEFLLRRVTSSAPAAGQNNNIAP